MHENEVDEPSLTPRGRLARGAVLPITIAGFVVAIDQLVKWWVLTHLEPGVPVKVVGNLVQFNLTFNSGAAFSFLENATWVFTALSSAVCIAIILYALRVRSMPWLVVLGMVLGGAAGNLTDRLVRAPGFPVGHVVDFVQVPHFAIFNVADAFISIAVVCFIVLMIKGVPTGRSFESPRAEDE